MNLNSIVNMVMRRLVSQGLNSAMSKGGDLLNQRGGAAAQQSDPLTEREEALARRERELELEARERALAEREAQARANRDE